MKALIQDLTCCCCGSHTRGQQWCNRDIGYGLCPKCVPCCKKGETEESFKLCYGIEGIHFNLKENNKE